MLGACVRHPIRALQACRQTAPRRGGSHLVIELTIWRNKGLLLVIGVIGDGGDNEPDSGIPAA